MEKNNRIGHSWPYSVNLGLAMKLTTVLLILSIFTVQANSYSQKTKVTLDLEKVSIQKVFEEIESLTDFKFLYDNRKIDAQKLVSIKVNNKPISDVLNNLFKDTSIYYLVRQKQIVLKTRTAPIPADIREESEVIEELKLGQQIISGTITDDTGQPLPGANVVEKGTTNGVTADFDGNFSLALEGESPVLVISYIGFSTQEITVEGRTNLSISLKEDAAGLEEVVVVGYGTQKKSDLTGSVESLSNEDFNKGAITSPDQLFQGKVAGVQVVQNNGEPGGGISISVRGAGSINAGSSPLYVIDGLPIENSSVFNNNGVGVPNSRSPRNPLSAINPSNIQSIEILKDASATAIYGSRGANGVILITTKSGKEGKMKVTYNSTYGIQNIAQKLNLLNPSDYQKTINDIIDEGGGNGDERVLTIENNGTDWQDEIFTQNAIIQNHDITFSGGNASNKYLVSLNNFIQEGLVIGSKYERYNARVNLKNDISENFKMGLNLTTTYSKDDFAPIGFNTNESAGAINAALYYDPSIMPRSQNGEFQRSSYITVDNPLAIATGIDGKGYTYRTIGSIFGEYFIIPDLSIRLNLGGDIYTQKRDSYVGRETLNGGANGGIGTKIQGQNTNFLAEGLLNYTKNIDNHSINTLFGATSQTFRSTSLTGTAFGFPSDATKTFNLQLGDPNLNRLDSNESENTLLSFLARVNYSYMNKYLATASIRFDGSSRFGENHKFGHFPSFALGWKIHEESFFESFKERISNLKFRVSWGETGNQEIGDLNAISTLGNGKLTLIGGELITTVEPKRIANPNLKWEKTSQLNLGLDFGLLNNRLSGNFDWYRKETSDMLIALPIPTSTGHSNILSNVGSIENSGFEFSLTSKNLNGALSWETILSLTTLKNKVNNLGSIEQIIQGSAGFSNQIFLIRKGQSLGSFYGYKTDGIWQEGDDFSITNDPVSPGDIKYVDINNDRTVNADDRVILGKSIPDIVWSITNSFNYKNFNFNVFFEGTHGASMLNNNLVDTYFPINLRRNRYAKPLLNRWTSDKPSNIFPSFVNPLGQGQKSVNSITVENASYVRLQSATISYDVPIKAKTLSSIAVSITGQNLAIWTDYSGFDPGINPNGGTINRVDYNAYPLARTFSLGLNITF